jgi:hypothetical protein
MARRAAAPFCREHAGTQRLRAEHPTAASVSAKLDTAGTSLGEATSTFVGPLRVPFPMNTTQANLARKAALYLTPAVIERAIIPLVTQSCSISLRILDWLVTNFSKKNHVILRVPGQSPMPIHEAYKEKLNFFRRRNFDPFRRKHPVFVVHKGKEYATTLGQCNFLQWADERGVLQYCHENRAAIERDQAATAEEARARKVREHGQGKKRTRQELSRAPARHCSIVRHHVVHCFNASQ